MSDARSGLLKSRWDPTRYGTLHAREAAPEGWEERPTVVLVHGLVISSLYMIPTAERLAPFFRTLAPDLPGFGLSHRPDHVLSIPQLADALADWMEALALRRTVLVGNSLGCQIIADLACRHRLPVVGAVLAGPTMDPHARTAPAQIGRWLADWTREPPSLAVAHVRDYYKAGLFRAWTTFRYALQDRVEAKLERVPFPTLVVRGSRDRIVPQRWAEEAAARLPRGSLQVIAGGPHVVNYTSAAPFAEIVRCFVQEIGAADPVRPAGSG